MKRKKTTDALLPELANGIIQLILDHQKKENLTVAAVIGVLEIVKVDLIRGTAESMSISTVEPKEDPDVN